VNGCAGNKSVTDPGRLGASIPLCEFCGSKVVATHNMTIRKVFLHDQFQITLPPNRNAIMLRANWRLPGGRAATYPREMPP